MAGLDLDGKKESRVTTANVGTAAVLRPEGNMTRGVLGSPEGAVKIVADAQTEEIERGEKEVPLHFGAQAKGGNDLPAYQLRYSDKIPVFDREKCVDEKTGNPVRTEPGASMNQEAVIDRHNNVCSGMFRCEADRVRELFKNEKGRVAFQGYLRKEYLEKRQPVIKWNRNSYNNDTGGEGTYSLINNAYY